MSRGKILVCVTDQYSCERLIKYGAELSKKLDSDMQVLNVSKPSDGCVTDGKALEFLYNKAKERGAEVVFYFNDDPVLITAGHAKKYGITHIIAGMPGSSDMGFIQMLHSLIPDVPITLLSPQEQGECITLLNNMSKPIKNGVR